MSPKDYPQALPFDEDEVETFLARSLIAKLCTHNEDGTIHIAPIWYRYDDGTFLMGTQEISRKVRNIKRDNRVTLMVDAQEPVLQAVIVQGRAVLEYEDVISRRGEIFARYVDDPDGLADGLAEKWKPVILRVVPEKMVTFDYSKKRSW